MIYHDGEKFRVALHADPRTRQVARAERKLEAARQEGKSEAQLARAERRAEASAAARGTHRAAELTGNTHSNTPEHSYAISASLSLHIIAGCSGHVLDALAASICFYN